MTSDKTSVVCRNSSFTHFELDLNELPNIMVSVENKYVRTLEDVRSIIGHAKLDENKLTCISQVLNFAPSEENYENYKLLEINPEILENLIEGQTVAFKGGRTEPAVLCTDTHTYEVKEAETSNSLLLVPDLLWSKESNLDQSLSTSQENDGTLDPSMNTSDIDITLRKLTEKKVLKVYHDYFELRPIKPRFHKLNQLLQLTRYSGPEHEYNIDKSLLFTYSQLLNTIQASRFELQEGLHSLKAMEIEGHFRVLDIEYEFRVLSYMLGLIDENSWGLDGILRKETIHIIKDVVPEYIVKGLFDIYTEKIEDNRYKYREDMVSQLYAQTILKNAAKFNLVDFLTAWQESLPEGMEAKEAYLKGVALIDRESSPPCVRGLNLFQLPAGVTDRFRELFKIKPRWTIDQISPYIECFTTPILGITTLLAKHARAYTENGVRYYGAKHA